MSLHSSSVILYNFKTTQSISTSVAAISCSGQSSSVGASSCGPVLLSRLVFEKAFPQIKAPACQPIKVASLVPQEPATL